MAIPIHTPTVPGLFVTGTDTGVGKTLVAAGIADHLRRRGLHVGVLKPVATGCVHRREGLVSEDAERLAAAASTRHPLDIVCPQRFAEPLAPAVAAERAGTSVDWGAVERALSLQCVDSDILIVEGVGGVRVPLDSENTVVDLMAALRLPAIVVARAALGTINHTLLTLDALRTANVSIAGVVVNRYPVDLVRIAEETNVRAIERWGGAPVLCVTPEEGDVEAIVPEGVRTAIDRVDWAALASWQADRP